LKELILDYIISQFGNSFVDGQRIRHYSYCLFPEKECSCVDIDNITYDTSLIHGGYVDSFSMAVVLIYLEKTFSIKISDKQAIPENFDTINNMVQLVESIKKDQIKLHTFGDSHCGFHECNWNAIKIDNVEIKSHWIGAVTCASFGVRKLGVLNIKEYDVNDGDVVCFSFGEIDVRTKMHILGNRYKKFIDRSVKNYFEAIKINISQFKDLKVMVSCIPPVAKDANDRYYPTIGSNEERKQYTEYMNMMLQRECNEYGYVFFNIYKQYSGDDGYMKPSMSDGHVHIKDARYMKSELLNILDTLCR